MEEERNSSSLSPLWLTWTSWAGLSCFYLCSKSHHRSIATELDMTESKGWHLQPVLGLSGTQGMGAWTSEPLGWLSKHEVSLAYLSTRQAWVAVTCLLSTHGQGRELALSALRWQKFKQAPANQERLPFLCRQHWGGWRTLCASLGYRCRGCFVLLLLNSDSTREKGN